MTLQQLKNWKSSSGGERTGVTWSARFIVLSCWPQDSSDFAYGVCVSNFQLVQSCTP